MFLLHFEILILCCGIVRMCCVLEDFLIFIFGFVFLIGLECECDHGCEGFLVGREEKSRVKGISWACMIEDLGVWVPLYAIFIHILLWG